MSELNSLRSASSHLSPSVSLSVSPSSSGEAGSEGVLLSSHSRPAFQSPLVMVDSFTLFHAVTIHWEPSENDAFRMRPVLVNDFSPLVIQILPLKHGMCGIKWLQMLFLYFQEPQLEWSLSSWSLLSQNLWCRPSCYLKRAVLFSGKKPSWALAVALR